MKTEKIIAIDILRADTLLVEVRIGEKGVTRIETTTCGFVEVYSKDGRSSIYGEVLAIDWKYEELT